MAQCGTSLAQFSLTKLQSDVFGTSRSSSSGMASYFSASLLSFPPPLNFGLRLCSMKKVRWHRITGEFSLPVISKSSVGRCTQRSLRGQVRAASVRNDAEPSTPNSVAINARDLGLTVTGDKGEEVVVLKGCSLQIPEGELWMLLGPNGCGKSTLLKALTGLLRPNRGKLYIVGPRSFVFQNPDHQVVMPTAEADVAFGLGHLDLTEEEVKARVHSSLEAVGMSEYGQRPVQTLSGGQKQRVAIAGALAESSRVLLLDELTTFLDEADQMGVLEAVRNVVGGSVTALWVTHRLEELDYADGAVYMENGRVVISGAVEEVKRYIHKQQEGLSRNGVLR